MAGVSFRFPLRDCWCAPYARQAPYRRPKINDNDHGVRMLASRSLRPPRYDPPQARPKTSLRKQINSDVTFIEPHDIGLLLMEGGVQLKRVGLEAFLIQPQAGGTCAGAAGVN